MRYAFTITLASLLALGAVSCGTERETLKEHTSKKEPASIDWSVSQALITETKPVDTNFAPFCSKRCADVDLGRWLKGGYAVPGWGEDGAIAANDRDSDADPEQL